MTEIIAPGTKVTWTSQANAGWKTKTGVVLAFCPAWKDPRAVLHTARGVAQLPDERADGLTMSAVDRYLVAVPRGGKSKLVDIYTPLASKVRI